jgi:ABC-2 type transport system permease protein
MLWYKAWVESRVRFMLAATVTLLLCAASVFWHDAIRSFLATHSGPADTYVSYIYRVLYQGFPKILFLTFAMILGMGGLLRERELGTAGFTLALPASRARLTLVRAAVGLIEVITLAMMPAIVIAAVSPIVHETYPVSQAVEFGLLWSAGGAALFSVAFLASSLFAGDYTAFVVAEIVLFGHTVSTQFVRIARPATRPYLFTVQEIMSGFRMTYFDPQRHLLVGPFPEIPVAALGLFTCVLIACALRYTATKDF